MGTDLYGSRRLTRVTRQNEGRNATIERLPNTIANPDYRRLLREAIVRYLQLDGNYEGNSY